MAASITLAGESLIAQKQAAAQPLIVTNFVLANVPGLNPNGPVNRAAGKPPAAQVVHTWPVTQSGFVNPNQVVYSLMMGTDVGDFDWNWIGLESSEGVLLSVAYVPVQQKRKNILPEQIGNNVTRNFLVVFDGAQQLTGIKVDASTWQHDFTARLKGIDERQRQSNRDMFGRACFFGSGLALEKVGNTYQLKSGIAYVEGIRLECKTAQPVAVPSVPNKAWLDVVLQRELSDVVGTFQIVFGTGKEDYTDSAGGRHYLVPLADLPSTSVITDLRPVEPIAVELIKHLAARAGDYPQLRARATTKEDVELSNIPNAIAIDSESDDPAVLATTRMVQLVRKGLYSAITALVVGTTAAGKATKLATARTFKFLGAATGSATFDGTADPEIVLTLADSGVAPAAYTKVSVNAKGLVISGSNPTTLGGFGITNAYTKAEADQQINYRVLRDNVTTVGLANNDPKLPYMRRENDGTNYYLQPSLGFTPVQQGTGIGQLQGYPIKIGWSGSALKATVNDLDLGDIWCSSNFSPSAKANWGTKLFDYRIDDAYTKSEVNNTLAQYIKLGQSVPAGSNLRCSSSQSGSISYLSSATGALEIHNGGVAAASAAIMFNRQGVFAAYLGLDTDNQFKVGGWSFGNNAYVLWHAGNLDPNSLQPRLGFSPVEQGGGTSQTTSKIRYGWDAQGRGMRVQVEGLDQGLQWGEKTFYRPDSNNFFAVSVTGTSVQLPAGGTWCYSLMHYYAAGQGVVGKSGQAAGGTVISFSGGATIYGFAWRYTP